MVVIIIDMSAALETASLIIREALGPAARMSAMSNARGISTGRLRLRRKV
jgi:hypothetical protein